MLAQSQERVPFVSISPEYTHTVLARDIVLTPAPSSFAAVSGCLPGGWQEATGCYLIAMVDLQNDCLPVVDSMACVRVDGVLQNVGNTIETPFSHEYLFDAEALLGRANVALEIGPIDMTGHSILSNIDLEIYRDETNDDWLGTITIKALILAIPQNSVGSKTPLLKQE